MSEKKRLIPINSTICGSQLWIEVNEETVAECERRAKYIEVIISQILENHYGPIIRKENI